MGWIGMIILVAAGIGIAVATMGALNKGERSAHRRKLQRGIMSEEALLGNVWRFRTSASYAVIWQQLQRNIVTGDADKGKLHISSSCAERIVYAQRIKGTTIGYDSQLDFHSSASETIASFAFVNWSFSAGELPFLREMSALLQSVQSAFRAADSDFSVETIRK